MSSLPLRLALKALLNVLLVWLMDRWIPGSFTVIGGWPAYVVIGALITLLNLLVRPILALITLPLKLVATIVATVLVNGIFLWLVYQISLLMDPSLIVIVIGGGLGGWILVSLIFGIGNWLMKAVLR